jgi:hypothetical protein
MTRFPIAQLDMSYADLLASMGKRWDDVRRTLPRPRGIKMDGMRFSTLSLVEELSILIFNTTRSPTRNHDQQVDFSVGDGGGHRSRMTGPERA